MKRRSAMNLRSTNPNAIGMKQVMFKNRVAKQGTIEDFLEFPLFLFYKCGNSAKYSKYETGVLIYIHIGKRLRQYLYRILDKTVLQVFEFSRQFKTIQLVESYTKNKVLQKIQEKSNQCEHFNTKGNHIKALK